MTKQSKQPEKNYDVEEYKEISEKKTSKLGYFLLIMMVIFIIIVGQTIFQDLKRLPVKPDRPAGCVYGVVCSANLKNMRHVSAPYFTETDRKFQLDKKYNRIKPALENIVFLNEQIKSIKSQMNSEKVQLESLREEYGLGLLETIAEEEKVLINKPKIKDAITRLRNNILLLEKQMYTLENRRDAKIDNIVPELADIKQSYNEAIEYYENKDALYNLKVFLLALLFVLPFFLFSLYYYLKLKSKDSPYTIVLTAVLTASSILFIQVVLGFLYKILPAEWFERIFEVLRAIPYLRFVIYYGSVLLVIAILGGIVYYIQKKAFSPKSIAMRRLKDNKCSACALPLDSSYTVCPKCGYQLKEKCPHCDSLKIRGLLYCPSCGEK